MSTTTTTPAARREAWLADVIAPANDAAEAGTPLAAGDPAWATILDRVLTEGTALGRSQAWQDAIAWHVAQRKLGRDASWIALQGNVWLTYAA